MQQQNEVKQEWQRVPTGVGLLNVHRSGVKIRAHKDQAAAVAAVLQWLGWGSHPVQRVADAQQHLGGWQITTNKLAIQQLTLAAMMGGSDEGVSAEWGQALGSAVGHDVYRLLQAGMKQKQQDAWARLNSRHDRMLWALQIIAAGKASTLSHLPMEDLEDEAEAARLLAQQVLAANKGKGNG